MSSNNATNASPDSTANPLQRELARRLLSNDLSDRLNMLTLRLRGIGPLRNVFEKALTKEQRASLGTDFESFVDQHEHNRTNIQSGELAYSMDDELNAVNLWKLVHDLSPETAILQIARIVSAITQDEYLEIRQEIPRLELTSQSLPPHIRAMLDPFPAISQHVDVEAFINEKRRHFRLVLVKRSEILEIYWREGDDASECAAVVDEQVRIDTEWNFLWAVAAFALRSRVLTKNALSQLGVSGFCFPSAKKRLKKKDQIPDSLFRRIQSSNDPKGGYKMELEPGEICLLRVESDSIKDVKNLSDAWG